MSRIRIRPLKTEKEFRACEDIQREVWGGLAISAEVLSVAQKYGGAVLGAMVAGEMAGFLCAFLAKRKGKLIHWSHMMAVRPRFRDRGLGFRMKLLHRRLAIDQGIRSICWTFDPLQSRNAKLNVGRLGVQIEEYIPDCYGEFPSRIEKGLPSDRFVACWPLASVEVERRLRRQPERRIDLSWPRVNETRRASSRFLENRRIAWNLNDRRLLVEIPANTDAMRERDLRLAKRWRMETRRIFQRYFNLGYRVEDFVTMPEGEEACFYVLSKAGSQRTKDPIATDC
jgi:predicted GNAT superfamily acetyltransferase